MLVRVLETVEAFRGARQGVPEPLGLVPTMGALHEGHLSLLRQARAACATVAMSLFVNPTQFGPAEDLSRYPRPLQRDLDLARTAGVDLVFHPPVEEMYPPDFATAVEVGGPASRWEGEHRPGHFRGVATVVARLLGIVGPQVAYFGEKDWQQLQVVRRMVRDLAIPVQIAPCQIVREPDGLALSSRNVYLEPEQRQYATALSRALRTGQGRVAGGERDALAVRRAIEAVLLDTPGLRPDYVAVVDPESLEPLERLDRPARALIAARLGKVRLIDNAPLVP
ncbi:MAG TPA: pantoate--beta-alanine ligase [Chloroflexota bacterium]|nr:pantoate--beta-alanine ligase [Chloroflexota bacterium]